MAGESNIAEALNDAFGGGDGDPLDAGEVSDIADFMGEQVGVDNFWPLFWGDQDAIKKIRVRSCNAIFKFFVD